MCPLVWEYLFGINILGQSKCTFSLSKPDSWAEKYQESHKVLWMPSLANLVILIRRIEVEPMLIILFVSLARLSYSVI